MEFVVVTYPIPRNVFMDGMPQGVTGEILRIQRGHHVFDLGLPHDYSPLLREENVVGTTKPGPMVVSFEPAAVVAAEAPPSGLGRPASTEPPTRTRRTRTGTRKSAAKRPSGTRRRSGRRSTRRSRKT